MATTIQVSDSVKTVLDRKKLFTRESYNEVIERMIEDDLELNEKTRKELGEREKNPKFISHEEAKKRLGF